MQPQLTQNAQVHPSLAHTLNAFADIPQQLEAATQAANDKAVQPRLRRFRVKIVSGQCKHSYIRLATSWDVAAKEARHRAGMNGKVYVELLS